jgi:hypothetical protein
VSLHRILSWDDGGACDAIFLCIANYFVPDYCLPWSFGLINLWFLLISWFERFWVILAVSKGNNTHIRLKVWFSVTWKTSLLSFRYYLAICLICVSATCSEVF